MSGDHGIGDAIAPAGSVRMPTNVGKVWENRRSPGCVNTPGPLDPHVRGYRKGGPSVSIMPQEPDSKPIRYGTPVAIPTTYRGCRFRSRLEARWAVFFDHLDIGWRYEPQGYEIGGRPYLPDFLLECGTWVEVKGAEDQLDYQLLRNAARELPVMPATGEPGPRLLILGHPPTPFEPWVTMRGDWAWLGVHPDGRGDEIDFASYGFGRWGRHCRPWRLGERTGDGPWLRPAYMEWEYDCSAAYAAANGARFEHGESGPA